VGAVLEYHVLGPPGEHVGQSKRVDELALPDRSAALDPLLRTREFVRVRPRPCGPGSSCAVRPRFRPGQADRLSAVAGWPGNPVDRGSGHCEQLHPLVIVQAFLI